jgi:Fe2+ transport system protein FeoA
MTIQIPLSAMIPGKTGKITAIDAGACLKKRLNDLGLYLGAKIEVVKNDGGGPLIVKILNSKIALGRGQCQKISVHLQS